MWSSFSIPVILLLSGHGAAVRKACAPNGVDTTVTHYSIRNNSKDEFMEKIPEFNKDLATVKKTFGMYTGLNPQCVPNRGHGTEFVVDFIFILDHTFGQDKVDRMNYLFKAISCEIPISKRYRLATAHVGKTVEVTEFHDSQTFPDSLTTIPGAEGSAASDPCGRFTLIFEKVHEHLKQTREWDHLANAPLHFVTPVTDAHKGCDVVAAFRDHFKNSGHAFKMYLDIVSFESDMHKDQPGVRVTVGSWNDIKTNVPSLAKYLDFKHVYKMDHLMQDYSKWIRDALSGRQKNDVFLLTTTEPRLETSEATVAGTASTDAPKPKRISPIVKKLKSHEHSVKKTKYVKPTQQQQRPDHRTSKPHAADHKRMLRNVEPEPHEEKPYPIETHDEMEDIAYQKAGADDAAADEPPTQQKDTPTSQQTVYRPYFIPLLILIIILALIIIFLLICIICLMKAEEKDERSRSKTSERTPLLSETKSDEKTPKKSPPRKKSEKEVPPAQLEPQKPQEPPQGPTDQEMTNFAPIIISGKPHKEAKKDEPGPGGAGGAAGGAAGGSGASAPSGASGAGGPGGASGTGAAGGAGGGSASGRTGGGGGGGGTASARGGGGASARGPTSGASSRNTAGGAGARGPTSGASSRNTAGGGASDALPPQVSKENLEGGAPPQFAKDGESSKDRENFPKITTDHIF